MLLVTEAELVRILAKNDKKPMLIECLIHSRHQAECFTRIMWFNTQQNSCKCMLTALLLDGKPQSKLSQCVCVCGGNGDPRQAIYWLPLRALVSCYNPKAYASSERAKEVMEDPWT